MPLSRKPQHVPKPPSDTWYYEMRGGIELHHDVKNTFGEFEKHITILIPWRKIKATIRRYRVGRMKVVKR